MRMAEAAGLGGRSARRRGGLVLAGLLLTFVGLVGLDLLLPSSFGNSSSDLLYAVMATPGLWFGGLLLGLGRSPRRPRGTREA